VEVDELWSEEEVGPVARAEHPLSVPGLTEETLSISHAWERKSPVTVSVLIHQVD